MEIFTDDERTALSNFRKRIENVVLNDYDSKDENLIRWLRARDLNLDKAEEIFRKNLTWREENKIDGILESGFDKEMESLFPFHIDGTDKEGRLVVCVPIGSWDIRASVEKDGPEKFAFYCRQVLEYLSRKIKAIHEKRNSNLPVSIQYTMICDYDGFGMKQLANMKSVNTILQIVSQFEAYYPETLHLSMVINAPSFFSILFNLMKPLMTARTINKMKIFTSDRQKWEPEVLALIDAKEIREKFGGTKTD